LRVDDICFNRLATQWHLIYNNTPNGKLKLNAIRKNAGDAWDTKPHSIVGPLFSDTRRKPFDLNLISPS